MQNLVFNEVQYYTTIGIRASLEAKLETVTMKNKTFHCCET